MGTVTFKPEGRLGNFLFKAATCIAYARKHDLKFVFPAKTNSQQWNPIYFPHLQRSVDQIDIVVPESTYFRFDQLQFSEGMRDSNILLEGYFQNPKYFDEYREEILSIFGFDKLKINLGVIGIHVRRGDFLRLREKHVVQTREWIRGAMEMFSLNGEYRFKFFSDDIEWCRENFTEYNTAFSFERDEVKDLIQLACCEHQIISASTFGWWGAYLNNNPKKGVVVPYPWMQKSHSNEWTEEIVPKTWMRVRA